MNVIHTAYSAPFCPLPLTDRRFAYVPSDHTDISETFRRFTPICVSPVGDDYDLVHQHDYLSAPGGFK